MYQIEKMLNEKLSIGSFIGCEFAQTITGIPQVASEIEKIISEKDDEIKWLRIQLEGQQELICDLKEPIYVTLKIANHSCSIIKYNEWGEK